MIHIRLHQQHLKVSLAEVARLLGSLRPTNVDDLSTFQCFLHR